MDELRKYRETHPSVVAVMMGALVLVGDHTAYQFFTHKGLQFPTARPGWKEMWDVVRHCIAPPTRQGAGADAGVLVQRMQVRHHTLYPTRETLRDHNRTGAAVSTFPELPWVVPCDLSEAVHKTPVL